MPKFKLNNFNNDRDIPSTTLFKSANIELMLKELVYESDIETLTPTQSKWTNILYKNYTNRKGLSAREVEVLRSIYDEVMK